MLFFDKNKVIISVFVETWASILVIEKGPYILCCER